MKFNKYIIYVLMLIQCQVIKGMDDIYQVIEKERTPRWLQGVAEKENPKEVYIVEELSTSAGGHRSKKPLLVEEEIIELEPQDLEDFEQKRKSLSVLGKIKAPRFSRQLNKYNKYLSEFNQLGSYKTKDFEDYVTNYREPVKRLMKILDITQTEENDPVFMAIIMNDNDFLNYLLTNEEIRKADPKFKSLRHFSARDLLKILEDSSRTRAGYNLTLEDVTILKNTMMTYRPDVFSFEERKGVKQENKNDKQPIEQGKMGKFFRFNRW